MGVIFGQRYLMQQAGFAVVEQIIDLGPVLLRDRGKDIAVILLVRLAKDLRYVLALGAGAEIFRCAVGVGGGRHST